MADVGSVISPWLGAIPLVGSVASTLINNASTNAANAANRQFQEQQQQQQNAYNLDMWNKQNDYNSPVNAMARFKAAGLNPNLIYGAGASGATFASAPPVSAKVEYVQQPHPMVDYATPLEHVVSSMNDLRLGNAQSQNIQADTAVKSAQLPNIEADTSLKNSNASAILASIPFIAPKSQSEIDSNEASAKKNIVSASVEQFLAPLQANLLSSQSAKSDADTQFTLDDDVRQAASNAMNLKEAVSRIALNYISGAKSTQEISQIKAATAQILNSNIFQQMDMDMREHNIMPHDSYPMRVLAGVSDWISSHLFGSNGTTTGGASGSKYPVNYVLPTTKK